MLDPRGLQVGINLDDIAIIPVATAMQLFNRAGLFRMILQTRAHADLDSVRDKVSAVLQERHDGEVDFTVLTQDAVVETLGTVLRVLTLALVAIAAISLSVAGIGIMNVMLVSVSERTSEIGLMRAIGAKRRHILAVFLAEAALLSTAGGILGVLLGASGAAAVVLLYPDLPRPAAAVGGGLGDHGRVGIRPGVRHAAGAARHPARSDRSAQESVKPRMTDLFALALSAVRAHKLRSFLSTLGIAIGVGSVVLLTSIGEGTRQFMIDQFTQFGTNIIAVHPGKAQTVGIPGMLGGTTNPLTLEDALAIDRLPQIDKAVPMAMASARVEAGELGRSVFVFGVTADVPAVFKFDVRQGSFWSESDARQGGQEASSGPP